MGEQSQLPGFEDLQADWCAVCGEACQRPVSVPKGGALCKECFREAVWTDHGAQQMWNALGIRICEFDWHAGTGSVGLFRTVIGIINGAVPWWVRVDFDPAPWEVHQASQGGERSGP